MQIPPTGHDPILVDEIRRLLPLHDRAVLVDCTLGRGGHALALAAGLGGEGLLVGLDADPRNLAYAQARLTAAGLACRVRLFHANYSKLDEVLATAGIPAVDAILADLGVSTNQLFDPAYGMSMSVDGPLDMRLDPDDGVSAGEIVNRWEEGRLADVLYQLAQERFSRRIARRIVEERRIAPILTTERLADIVRSAIPVRGGAPEKIDPATRTFMALRMEANRELAHLERLLQQAPGRLTPGGSLAVMSFHSGEDRLVKQAFRARGTLPDFRVATAKPITPQEVELTANPRSRSAKLRVLQRVRPDGVPDPRSTDGAPASESGQ